MPGLHPFSLYTQHSELLSAYASFSTAMKFISLAAALAFALPAFAQTTVEPVTYDTTYDEISLSLSAVACSNGANGLLTKGYTTLGSLPTYPNLGGAYTVTGWNSPECGTCYNITYGGKSLIVTAVDVAEEGFNLSEEAMNVLTGGLAIELGRVNVESTPVAASYCGL
ncbi:Cerato-platanin-domain-containing protein [Boletus edulis BED1]|uniref:Cerato-platanin-domain-containing protein n=1 Tax=Boletus edulis BED1 TaxID=1328754 RepID=A0AAD4BQM7_BOLED|nr:Cerato-platanin-domain-containing protein [Boletus edulis BED1]